MDEDAGKCVATRARLGEGQQAKERCDLVSATEHSTVGQAFMMKVLFERPLQDPEVIEFGLAVRIEEAVLRFPNES
ncbi:MAG: hypothetical protein N3G20_07690 [Verrucomicrobiae bacterium]|nr:hypothetical protein [Verrucomicrobiae bacterium]